MDNFIVAMLSDADNNFEIPGGDFVFHDAADARDRAFEVQRCRPERRVCIFRASEFVEVEMSTSLAGDK